MNIINFHNNKLIKLMMINQNKNYQKNIINNKNFQMSNSFNKIYKKN